MAAFNRDETTGVWQPAPNAAGPFIGIQGGAVGGLLVAEIEARAREEGWGHAVSASVSFLRPTPQSGLRTELIVLHEGGRSIVVDSTLRPSDDPRPTSLCRVLLLKPREVEVPGFEPSPTSAVDPGAFPVIETKAAHGGPWFMDTMDARKGDDAVWFRLRESVVKDAGPLSRVLGPADWAHGLNRPIHGVVADPNANLSVHLIRAPVGDWVGVRAQTTWRLTSGSGIGHGVLLDEAGEIGSVAMSVALTPFPTADGH